MDRTRAALLLTGLLAAVVGPVGAAAAATGSVYVEDYGYSPTPVRIQPADRVLWTNQANQVHTITSDDPDVEAFDSGRLDKNEEYSHTFKEAGTYAYHCEVHSSMKGVVQVGEPPTTTTSSTTTSTTTPSSTTTTTQPPPTTTTTRPAPTTTTTTVPRSPSTTVTTSRAPSGAEAPAPTTSTAPATTTTAPAATTTTAPVSTSTTLGETTTTTVPAASEPATPLGPEVPQAPPPQEEDGEGDLAGQNASAPRSRDSGGGGADAGVILLVLAVVGAGAFGGWTLWKLRPGNT